MCLLIVVSSVFGEWLCMLMMLLFSGVLVGLLVCVVVMIIVVCLSIGF